ncbi:MAG: hypothetical protein DWQ30_13400 [Acidobacteria bacterium]|nr:MAG: hypothetical protein DWQ30_13400 [Acidobacteriota bacterium]
MLAVHLLLLASAGATPAVAASDAPPWSRLELVAKKLVLKAQEKVEAEMLSPQAVQERLQEYAEHRGADPHGETMAITTVTTFLGRSSRIETLLRPDLEGLQRCLVESGERARFKTYRFGPEEVVAHRGEPAGAPERSLPADQWSRTSETRIPVEARRADEVLTDAIALLVAPARLSRERLRSGVSFRVFSGSDEQRVSLRETGVEQHTVDYTLGDGSRIHGPRPLRIFEITPQPTRDGADAFELLGMEGPLVVRVDYEHLVPVEIEGRMPVLGTIVIRLEQAVLGGSG